LVIHIKISSIQVMETLVYLITILWPGNVFNENGDGAKG